MQVREISNDEGNQLLRIVRRSSGSMVTWRRAQMVRLSAQGMAVPQIAEVGGPIYTTPGDSAPPRGRAAPELVPEADRKHPGERRGRHQQHYEH